MDPPPPPAPLLPRDVVVAVREVVLGEVVIPSVTVLIVGDLVGVGFTVANFSLGEDRGDIGRKGRWEWGMGVGLKRDKG